MKRSSPENSREFLSELKIEAAEARDIPGILQIAEQVKLDPKNLDKEKLGKGFLVYTLSGEQYAARLNEYFTVARSGGGCGWFFNVLRCCFSSRFD